MTKKPLSIYVHIPFCKHKCAYCHFFTFSGKVQKSPVYFQSMLKELESYQSMVKDYEISTLYFGGGTPSMVEEKLIGEIIDFVKANYRVSADLEITIESNPESINPQKLDYYLSKGVNRISIGLQAWQNHLLKYLQRHYTIEEFLPKFEMVKDAGFENINLDLIFGIPGQTMDEWVESVTNVINLKPNHISAYSLELDNDSLWGRLYEAGKFKPAEDSLDREMYTFVIDKLNENGYKQYEISNFAKEGRVSKHNLSFWQGQEYIGIGAAAHSYFQNHRYSNIYSIEKYMSLQMRGLDSKVDKHKLSKSERILDLFILRLRLNEGVNIAQFNKENDCDLLLHFEKQFPTLLDKQFLNITSDKISLNRKGIDFYNEVVRDLM